MRALRRAGALVVLFAWVMTAASIVGAAEKPFHRDDLGDSAIKLEAQIRASAGPVTRPVAALKRDADSAAERGDFRAAMQILSQVASVTPNDAANWLRLSRAALKVHASLPATSIIAGTDSERTALLERAATCAYIAYRRSRDPLEEAESLVVLGRTFADRAMWRPALDALRLSLEIREAGDVRALYESMRAEHGFRIVDNTVDSDAAAPRACFQFSEDLAGRRTDFSPFVAVAGQDRPALSVDGKQLCVEGLTHGETYDVTLRAGLPSAVHETLAKSAEFNIYVRDRAPFVHFTGNAYVLPRAGQRGIPVVSVNTPVVRIEIYRIGDRNLTDAVLGSDFKHSLSRYDIDRLNEARGVRIWKGELDVASTLNADVTTAFPVDATVGTLEPGVYVMVAEPAGPPPEGALATQWFIVSDLGLAAFSGADGTTVLVHSLATTDAKTGVAVRLVARNNEVLATRATDAAGVAHFEAGLTLTRGEGGLSPALVVAEDKGDYAFLNLRGPSFDLSDRGVSGRAAPAGLDAFVYAERGVYRSGETVHITALLWDARGQAAQGVPLTLVVERPDGVEYRRDVRVRSGHRRPLARGSDRERHPGRHLARSRLHRPQAAKPRRARSWSRTTCPTGLSLSSKPMPPRSRRGRPLASPSTAAISMGHRPRPSCLRVRLRWQPPANARDLRGTSSASPTRNSHRSARPWRIFPRPISTEARGSPSRSIGSRRPRVRSKPRSRSA